MSDVDPRLRGYADVRNDLLRLSDQLNKLRIELLTATRPLTEAVAKLVEQSDRLSGKALAEYGPKDGFAKVNFKGYDPETDVQAVADHVRPSRRACSVCHKPGHRAPNCPDAHLAQEQKKEKVAERDAKKAKKRRKK